MADRRIEIVNRRTVVMAPSAALILPLAQRATMVNLGCQPTDVYSLLNVLTEEERADALSGTNSIDITGRLADLIASVPEGATVDATMLRGDVELTSTIFTSPYRTPLVLKTGHVRFTRDYNAGPLLLPSGLRWEMARTSFGRTVETADVLSDASPAKAMLQTFTDSGEAYGTAGQSSLSVQYPSTIQIGGLISVEGLVEAGEIVLELAEAISSTSQSTIVLDNTAAAPHVNGIVTDTIGASVVYLKIGAEIVKGIVHPTTGNVTAVQRGALGTTAATHSSGSTVTLMKTFVARVTDLAGDLASIDTPLPRSFTGAKYRVGSVGTQLVGDWTIDGGFDGHPISDGWGCLSATLATDFFAEGGKLKNAPHSGIFLFACEGARCQIAGISNCGRPASNLGSAVWIFGGGSDNRVAVDSITGGFLAAAIDNKSFGVPGYGLIDPPTNCRIEIGSILGAEASINVSTASDNVISVGRNAAPAPVVDKGDSQVVNPITTRNNVIRIGRQDDVASFPSGNALSENTVSINGRSEREVSISWVTDTTIYVPYNDNFTTTLSLPGAKEGDVVTINPTAPLVDVTGGGSSPAKTIVTAACFAPDVVTAVFQAQAVGTKEIAPGAVFTVRARGPW